MAVFKAEVELPRPLGPRGLDRRGDWLGVGYSRVQRCSWVHAAMTNDELSTQSGSKHLQMFYLAMVVLKIPHFSARYAHYAEARVVDVVNRSEVLRGPRLDLTSGLI